MRNPWWPLLLLLIALLSGCLGAEDAASPETPTAPLARATATTGSLHGQVVSADFEPLEGVGVALHKDDSLIDGTFTDRAGRYTLNDVTPDAYEVRTFASGYAVTAKTVTVAAGVITETPLVLHPLPDLSNLSYVVPDQWTGFLGCGFGGPVYASLCSEPMDGVTIDENDDILEVFTVAPGVEELVFGMDWSPSGGFSARTLDLTIMVDIDPDPDTIQWRIYREETGPPPIVFTINDTWLQQEGLDGVTFATFNETRDVLIRVLPPFTFDPVIVYQQPFTVYWETYYHTTAPDGRSPIPDH
ncbi:MAG: carboxypeptidase-like regulatory domain-containing protein [Euryarchaeota archaeon]|nr:carboxypeptidase-like regulatory domain-containing protein [Euryarchaeota archaeon]